MIFKDLRQFIDALERTGDLVRIKQEVDWDLEAAAITARSCEIQGPAPFFERLKDYPEGGRLFGAPLATYRRLAIALGFDPNISVKELMTEYERRIKRPVKPIIVKDGPCNENRMLGTDVDLYRFPAPMVHNGDGGRYVGTWHIVVTKDPDSEWINWGMYRLMIHNKRNLVGLLMPFQHLGSILYSKYIPKRLPMPFAVVLGASPLCSLVAGVSFKKGESEVDYAGGLSQEPIQLIKCETNDLLVPAYAEIVIEGEILPNVKLPEGPFGEFPGYRTGGSNLSPALQVKAITYRNNPIICMCTEGIGITDRIGPSIAGAIEIKNRLLRHGINVVDVHMPPEMMSLVAVVSVKAKQANIASKIMDVVHKHRTLVPKIIIVDEDIDIFNLAEVAHAFATRCHPSRGTTISPEREGWTLFPYLSPQERAERKVTGVIYDCTWPPDWTRERDIPVRLSFGQSFPKELQDKVISKWNSYGFK